jgi:hypothetical protein
MAIIHPEFKVPGSKAGALAGTALISAGFPVANRRSSKVRYL